MDLIPGVVIFIGAIATAGLLGLDTFQNLRPITNAKFLQSPEVNQFNQQKQKKGLFNRGQLWEKFKITHQIREI